MAFPEGVTTATISLGTMFDFRGNAVDKVTAKVEVFLGGNATKLNYRGTGQTVVPSVFNVDAEEGMISFQLPHVDQPGFFAGDGSEAKYWAYIISIQATPQGSKPVKWVKRLQPVIGQTSIDLDNVVDGELTSFVSTPQATVTSVNGQTGEVWVSGDGSGGSIDLSAYATKDELEAATQSAGLPPGGAPGQVLSKATSANYAALWVDPPTASSGTGTDTSLSPQWIRGQVASGTDVRTLATGAWTVASNAIFDSLVNKPPAAARGLGIIEVLPLASSYKTIRWTLIPTSGAPQQWVSSQFGSGWGAWQGTGWNKGDIPTGSDVTKLSAGAYRVSSFATFDSLVNVAKEARGIGTVVVLELTASARTITWVTAPSTGDPRMFYGYVLSGGFMGWYDWTPTKAPTAPEVSDGTSDTSNSAITTSPSNAGLRNAMLREAFYRRYRNSTGGKAAISLRFDDGHNAFKTDILPMLRARSLPCSIAVCSRRWDHVENNAVTPEEMNSWVLNDKVEVWNHTATHRGANGAVDEIVNGLTELRTQLPAAEIWGWYAPGIDNGFGGFLPTREPHQLSSTLAGQLALANHACVSGYIAGASRRPLDPMPQTTAGFAHYSLDGRALADAKAEVDKVIAERARENFMMHPSRLDLSNGISRADMAELLDYIVAQRDAGKLVVLSPYQMEAATI